MKKLILLLIASLIAFGSVIGVQSSASATTIDSHALVCQFQTGWIHPNINGTLTLTSEVGADGKTDYYVTLDLNDSSDSIQWQVAIGHDNSAGGGIYDTATPVGNYHKKFGPYGPHTWYDAQIYGAGGKVACSTAVYR